MSTLRGGIAFFVIFVDLGCVKHARKREDDPVSRLLPPSTQSAEPDGIATLMEKARVFRRGDMPKADHPDSILAEDVDARIQQLPHLRVREESPNAEKDCPSPVGSTDLAWDGDFLVQKATYDMTACMNTPASGEEPSTTHVEDAKLTVGTLIGCLGDSKSAHKNLAPGDAIDRQFSFCAGDQLYIFQQNRISYRYTSKASERVTISGRAEIAQTFSRDIDEPCPILRREGLWRIDNCGYTEATQFLDVEIKGSEDIKPSDFAMDSTTKLKFNAVSYGPDDRFFRTGQADLELNGWVGAVRFAGASNAPRWSVHKDGDERSGTFVGDAAPASLQLRPSPGSRLVDDLVRRLKNPR